MFVKNLIIIITVIFKFSLLTAETNIITAAHCSYPPFIDYNSSEQGLSMEIVRASYETQGYKVKLINVPFARAIAGVRKGIYDILPNTWLTDERQEFLLFSVPYIYNEIKFIKLKNDDFEYFGLESLTGKRIGTIIDYGYDNEFLQADNFVRDSVTDFLMNIRKLIVKRIDLTLEDEIVATRRIINEAPELMEKISFTENVLTRKGIYVTAGYENPKHEELIEAFNKGLKIIKENGTYDAIMKKYGLKKENIE